MDGAIGLVKAGLRWVCLDHFGGVFLFALHVLCQYSGSVWWFDLLGFHPPFSCLEN